MATRTDADACVHALRSSVTRLLDLAAAISETDLTGRAYPAEWSIAQVLSQGPASVPYFDLTISAVKSVSVLHASYRVSARLARDRGEQEQAAALDARADEIEAALMDSAREAVAWLERHATYTRTGHHSARTGEWRDGDGLVASLFLHHLSRDGARDLQLRRADGSFRRGVPVVCP